MSQPPTAFISYSWDDEAHKDWVRALATRLRADGVLVALDQWETVPGDQLPAYMERSIRENQFVLVVCTPGYTRKSDERSGGVGYEGDIITGEIYTTSNHRKFIPIWRGGTWQSAAPSWIVGKHHVDLRGEPYSETHYTDLLTTFHGAREIAPPVGAPFATTRAAGGPAAPTRTPNPSPDQSLSIVGVIVDDVTQPRADGSRGSALYAVPFRLSRKPDRLWSELFVSNWDRPPRWTSMHRPGIAYVAGDRIVLDGTTLEEVEEYHRETLVLALAKTNEQYAEVVERRGREEAARRAREEAHRRDVEERANRLKFD